MEKLGLYSTEPVHSIVGQESGLTHHQWSWLQHTICTLGQVQQPLGFLSPAHKTKMWAVSKLGFRSVSNLHCQHYTQAGNIFSYSCEKSEKKIWLGLLPPAILSRIQLSSLYSVWDTKCCVESTRNNRWISLARDLESSYWLNSKYRAEEIQPWIVQTLHSRPHWLTGVPATSNT